MGPVSLYLALVLRLVCGVVSEAVLPLRTTGYAAHINPGCRMRLGYVELVFGGVRMSWMPVS